jgi:hypothetical protein
VHNPENSRVFVLAALFTINAFCISSLAIVESSFESVNIVQDPVVDYALVVPTMSTNFHLSHAGTQYSVAGVFHSNGGKKVPTVMF